MIHSTHPGNYPLQTHCTHTKIDVYARVRAVQTHARKGDARVRACGVRESRGVSRVGGATQNLTPCSGGKDTQAKRRREFHFPAAFLRFATRFNIQLALSGAPPLICLVLSAP